MRGIKNLVPPAIIRLLRPSTMYRGHYDWQEAKNLSTGYDKPEILEKVVRSVRKVKSGEAVFERDSALFTEKKYSWPLLTGLLVASREGRLHVIDFGGSLGSTYFQHRELLKHLNLKWDVVEQPHFVKAGKEFETEHLNFKNTIEECGTADVTLVSSVLQYLEHPFEFLETLTTPYIIIDRTTFVDSGKDFICVQRVAPKVFDASMPVHFFNWYDFKNRIPHTYEIISEFEALGGSFTVNRREGVYRGLILKKI